MRQLLHSDDKDNNVVYNDSIHDVSFLKPPEVPKLKTSFKQNVTLWTNSLCATNKTVKPGKTFGCKIDTYHDWSGALTKANNTSR